MLSLGNHFFTGGEGVVGIRLHMSAPIFTALLPLGNHHGYGAIVVDTGRTSPRFWYATPPPLPALRAHLVAKGQQLLAIHMVAPKAPKNIFFHFVHFAPQHYP